LSKCWQPRDRRIFTLQQQLARIQDDKILLPCDARSEIRTCSSGRHAGGIDSYTVIKQLRDKRTSRGRRAAGWEIVYSMLKYVLGRRWFNPIKGKIALAPLSPTRRGD